MASLIKLAQNYAVLNFNFYLFLNFQPNVKHLTFSHCNDAFDITFAVIHH